MKADYERLAGGATWTNTDGVLFRPTWQWNYDLYVDEIRLSNSKTLIHNTLTGGSIGQIASARSVTSTGGNGSLGLTDTWYHYDHIGNVMNLSNSSGAMVSGSIQHQDAWGNVLSSTTTGAWASIFSGRHLTTKEYDQDAGLYYFWQRWYERRTGLFASEAPSHLYLEHPYGYALGNPLSNIDPRGTEPASAAEFECLCNELCKSIKDSCSLGARATKLYPGWVCKAANAGCKVLCATIKNTGGPGFCDIDKNQCILNCATSSDDLCLAKCQRKKDLCLRLVK